jgi:hypothetical protein
MSGDESTGSESHFVSCSIDEDCPRGSCVDAFCEVNGERISSVSSVLGGGEGVSNPSGGDSPNCIELERTPIDLADAGLSAEDFTLVDATAELTWDGSGWEGEIDVVPLTGSTQLTVNVSVDEQSAERVIQMSNVGQGGTPPYCPELVEVDLTYSFSTADGGFDESGTVRQVVNTPPRSMDFTLPASELGGALRLDPIDPDASVSVSVSLWWPEQEFSGRVGVGLSREFEDVATGSGQPRFAVFSRTGCRVGSYLAAPDSSFGGLLISDELRIFDAPQVWAATWQDTGAETEFTLNTQLSDQALCHDGRELLMVADMSASTADGRLQQLPLSGQRRLSTVPDDPERILDRQWTANSNVACGGDPAFDGLDCDTMAGLSASFVFNTYENPGTGSGNLTLYLYEAPPVGEGASDAHVELQLSE